MAKKESYRYFENTSTKTSVLGTKHPNLNLWLPTNCVLQLTTSEVDDSGMERFEHFKEVKDSKRIKDALRPDAARKAIIDGKFKKDKDAQKKRDEEDKDPENDSFAAKPTLAKIDPLSGKPIKTKS